MGFADDISTAEQTMNKWTPEALISFVKEAFGNERGEAHRKMQENGSITTVMNTSKSLGNLDLWFAPFLSQYHT